MTHRADRRTSATKGRIVETADLEVRATSDSGVVDGPLNRGQQAEHLVDVVRADVEMRRHTDPALARCAGDAIAFQLRYERTVIHCGVAKADDSRTVVAVPFRHHFVALGSHSRF